MQKTKARSLSYRDPLDTPVMLQFQELKRKYMDVLLFFRMGDFYELFLEDAKKAAPIMEVTLTERQGGVPMAGVPYHSAENYIKKLLDAGLSVAIAEQEADPRNPRLMCRRVRRVITPGTLIEDRFLDSISHNYLMALIYHEKYCGIALADVSTGDFFSFDLNIPERNSTKFIDNVVECFRDYYARFQPREVLMPTELYNEFAKIPEAKFCVAMESWKASPTEGRRQIANCYKQSLKGLGYEKDWCLALGAVSLILHYLEQNYPAQKPPLEAPVFRDMQAEYMQMNEASISNLELIENKQDKNSKRSLYAILNECKSPPGKRLLKENLLMPLLDLQQIKRRQQLVALFYKEEGLCESIREEMAEVADLERILTRLANGRGSPRDFLHIQATLQAACAIEALVQKEKAYEMCLPETLYELKERIEREVDAEAPPVLGADRPFIKAGVDVCLDKARKASHEGSRWIIEFEKRERIRSKINTLRVKYNKVHGYFIETSRQQAKELPPDYYRLQTLVSYERFSCPNLAELAHTLNEAQNNIRRIEEERFQNLCQSVLAQISAMRALIKQLATLDFLCNLAFIARKKGWCMPYLNLNMEIDLKEAYHPVVEHYLPVGKQFQPNDLKMDSGSRKLCILTGPNMAGKSTYIRQMALIQILAQIGSFVPAKKAKLGLCDRIFTRIGSGDNISRGESTFYTEMLETARILNQATQRSLVIMDEVGRGTSTYDGLSLAWAIVEYLIEMGSQSPLTLFATHYYELTSLESIRGVFNLTMAVHETEGEVIFLHRVRPGSARRAYGIHVARLAGMPMSVLEKAENKLRELEQNQLLHRSGEDMASPPHKKKTAFLAKDFFKKPKFEAASKRDHPSQERPLDAWQEEGSEEGLLF